MVTYDLNMTFAIVATLMSLVAIGAISLPLLLRMNGATSDIAGLGASVYRDQLRELQREREEGLIDDAAYEAARAEVARRLLSAKGHDADNPVQAAPAPSRRNWIGLAVIAVFIAAAGFAYPYFGAPGRSDMPLAARMNGEEPDIAVLISRVERHLMANPDDARGWQVVAPIYFRQGRFADARAAYENAIRLSEPDADLFVGLGETIVASKGGTVTDEAVDIFRRAAALPGGDARAGFFLALADEQSGNYAEALRRFAALSETLPSGAPLRDLIDRHTEAIRVRLADEGVVQNGPDKQAMDAAADLSGDDRNAMIEGMVSGLAARLSENPDDLDGWRQLIRSYAVLGDVSAARNALEEATAYFGVGSDAADQLATLALALEIDGDQP